MKPLRIGLLASSWGGPGGIQVYTRELARALAAHGARGQLHARSYLDLQRSVPPEEFHGYRSVSSAGGSRARFLASLLRLPRLDCLIAAHLSLSPLALLLRGLGWARRYGTILYGLEAWERLPLARRRAVGQADFVVAVSRFTLEQYRARNGGIAGLVAQIPPYSPLEEVEPDPASRLPGDFRILAVSRMDPAERYKGFDTLLEAVAGLEGEPTPALHLVGEGADRARLEAEARRLRLGIRVHFWGALPPSALATAYAQAHAFALPSSREGFGIVFLEAMLHGLPCVGARAGALPELIADGETGWLVPAGDPSALRAALDRLRRDPEAARAMGRRGRELARERFGRARFEDAWRDLLQAGAAGVPR